MAYVELEGYTFGIKKEGIKKTYLASNGKLFAHTKDNKVYIVEKHSTKAADGTDQFGLVQEISTSPKNIDYENCAHQALHNFGIIDAVRMMKLEKKYRKYQAVARSDRRKKELSSELKDIM